MASPLSPILVVLLLLLILPSQGGSVRRGRPYTEEERQAEYKRRGYTFPIEEFNPNTPGWNALMSQRVSQLMANPVSQERWDGWIQTMASAMTVPNHTEYGWGLTHAPEELTATLQQAIYEGLPNAREEGKIDVIDGPNIPLFIDRPDLTRRVSLYWVSPRKTQYLKICDDDLLTLVCFVHVGAGRTPTDSRGMVWN